jgi:hypothetical protein
MKNFMVGLIVVGLLGWSICLIPYLASAQQTGFLDSSAVAPPSSDSMLPPGAVRQGGAILHTINSAQENLHLLSGFYYGNTRQWRKIYQDNRDVIKNPNRLPVGDVIRIQVGENWQPMVAYDQWFALATRNGEWQPGVPWKRARAVAEPASPPSSEKSSGTSMSETVTPAASQTLPPTPSSQLAPPTEAPPSERPGRTVEPQVQPEATPMANKEVSSEAAPEQDFLKEDTSSEDGLPAEPAF